MNKQNKTALIAGATGLAGSQLLMLLLNDEIYSEVKAITRKPLGVSNKKLNEIIVDFDQLETYAEELNADDIFCCLGTTIKKAGSNSAFKKVDYEYPIKLAKIGLTNSANQFLIITAMGADINSRIFYNKVKGEVEEDLKKLNFPSLKIFRPSLLIGDRKEFRLGEKAGEIFMKIFSFIIPLKYRGVDVQKVAEAMIKTAKENEPGLRIIESDQIQKIGSSK